MHHDKFRTTSPTEAPSSPVDVTQQMLAPESDLIVKRFCSRPSCNTIITQPPYMRADCCSNAHYHEDCTYIDNWKVTQCPQCNKMPQSFEADKDFENEVKKYDWDIFSPMEPEPAATPTTTPHAPHSNIPDNTGTEDEDNDIAYSVPVQETSSDNQSEQVGKFACNPGQHELRDITDSVVAITEKLKELTQDIAYVSTAPQKNTASSAAATHEEASDSPIAFIIPVDVQDLTVSDGTESDAFQVAPQDPAPIPKTPFLPTELSVHGNFMMTAVGRALEVQYCHPSTLNQYICTEGLNQQGIVPFWRDCCDQSKIMAGAQCPLQSRGTADAFFHRLQAQLSNLPAGTPLIFAYTENNPDQTGMRLARIVVLLKASGTGQMLLLQTREDKLINKLQVISLPVPVAMAQYLQLLCYMSLAQEAMFVRPPTSGTEFTDELEPIDVQTFSHYNTPRDAMPGNPTNNDRKSLAALARAMRLIPVKKENTGSIPHLPLLLSDAIRNEHTTEDTIHKELAKNEYRKTTSKAISIPRDQRKEKSAGLDIALSMHPDTFDNHLEKLQGQTVTELNTIMASLESQGYITVRIRPNGGREVPDEYLCIVCDKRGKRYHLVNMSNPTLAVLSTKNFHDLSNYLQAFLGGRRANAVKLTGFAAPNTP